MTDDVLTLRDKGLPARAAGLTTQEFLATQPRLSEFWTPLLALADDAIEHNLQTMAAWCRDRGLEVMPHGKTTMAPTLWQRQLDAGCPGITLATMGQVRTACDLGFSSFMLANSVTDPAALTWLAGQLRNPALSFVSWADSTATVEAMEGPLRDAGTARPVDVCVELGASGGRTGARSVAEAVTVAERIAASDTLRLAGVAGYEGSLGHDRSTGTLDRIRAYLEHQVEVLEAIAQLGDDGERILSAGGSAYFDVVADVYRSVSDPRIRRVLRSGAYVVHDGGFYQGISPFDQGASAAGHPRFLNAMRGYARVVSRPEPDLALVDAGKRDFPYDEGLPTPRTAAAGLSAPWRPLEGATVSAMNDQHSYVRGAEVSIGEVVTFDLSHPCTAFDKWRLVPVVESHDSDLVVDLVRTYF